MFIQPTVGRIVWYWPDPSEDAFPCTSGEQLAAVVAKVEATGELNLCIMDSNGSPHHKIGVLLHQDSDTQTVLGGFATWMPYQIGQAKKLDQEANAVEAK